MKTTNAQIVGKYNKVMIIEDNDLDAYVLATLVRKNNIAKDVLEFKNGMEAIKYLELNKIHDDNLPDIIFLDICMPLMDGYEFLDQLAKIEIQIKSKCRIFMVSSCLDEINILKSKKYANVVSCIAKPINTEFLFKL